MADSDIQTGGCLCGAVRFELDRSQVATTANCHCRDCQRATGSGFATICGVPDSGFVLKSGELASFVITGESGGTVERWFCPRCGSPIKSQASLVGELVFVKAGALDESDWLEPDTTFWSSSARSWAPVVDCPTVFDRNPS